MWSPRWTSNVFEHVRCRERARGLWCGSCCWPLLVSMFWASMAFDDVLATAGRGLGRVTGRGVGRWCGTFACSSVFEGVGGCVGRRLGRSSGRWWTTSACSRVWSHLVVVVWVVSVVWVGSWWTTFVALGWAFWVFEGVGGGVGCRLGRLVACVWSPPVTVRRASVVRGCASVVRGYVRGCGSLA